MIHTSYTVGITTCEYKALQTVMVDQRDWAEHQLRVRAQTATDDIISKYTNFKIKKGEAITAIGTTALIVAAISEGGVGIAT